MSAIISNKVMMKEVLKATGFDCPDGMENKTFEEVASGSGEGSSRTPQELNVTANGNYNTPDGVYYDPISVNVPLPSVTIVSAQAGILKTSGTPVGLSLSYPMAEDPNYVVWVGNEQINTRDIVAGQQYTYTTLGSGFKVDITLYKQRIGGGMYRVTAEFKGRNSVLAPFDCFLVIGTLN